MLDEVRLGLIVVTYNSQDTIEQCLHALIGQCQESDEIIVYDNGSSDDTPMILKKFGSQISLTLSTENSGFAYACNWCSQQASHASHLAFINPDAIVGKDLIYRAKETLADDIVSLVGFSCKNMKGQPDRNFRRYPGVFSGFLTIADRLFERTKIIREEKKFSLDSHYLDGSCMFICRNLFFSANQFEELFLYGEDVILCDTLKRKRICSNYLTDVSYTHARGGSSSSASGERGWSMLPNMVYSELYFLRDRALIVRGLYLILKFTELLLLASLYTSILRKNREKKFFFRQRLFFFLKYSMSFFIKGANFAWPEFHVLSKKS